MTSFFLAHLSISAVMVLITMSRIVGSPTVLLVSSA
jgi:hypothetical protein